MQWNTQSDNALLELAAKHPRGEDQVSWTAIIKDPMWKWGPVKGYVLAHRYAKLTKSNGHANSAKLPEAQTPANSDHVLNFCPSCGTNLFAIRTALELEAQLERSK